MSSSTCITEGGNPHAQTGIHNLPFELLAAIFVRYVVTYGQSPATLTLVCRYWYHCAHGTQELWAGIALIPCKPEGASFKSPEPRMAGCTTTDHVRSALRRCPISPLDLLLVVGRHARGASNCQGRLLLPLLNALAASTPSIRSLRIYSELGATHFTEPTLQQFLSRCDITSLHSLHLNLHYPAIMKSLSTASGLRSLRLPLASLQAIERADWLTALEQLTIYNDCNVPFDQAAYDRVAFDPYPRLSTMTGLVYLSLLDDLGPNIQHGEKSLVMPVLTRVRWRPCCVFWPFVGSHNITELTINHFPTDIPKPPEGSIPLLKLRKLDCYTEHSVDYLRSFAVRGLPTLLLTVAGDPNQLNLLWPSEVGASDSFIIDPSCLELRFPRRVPKKLHNVLADRQPMQQLTLSAHTIPRNAFLALCPAKGTNKVPCEALTVVDMDFSSDPWNMEGRLTPDRQRELNTIIRTLARQVVASRAQAGLPLQSLTITFKIDGKEQFVTGNPPGKGGDRVVTGQEAPHTGSYDCHG